MPACNTPQLWQPKLSPDIAEGSLESKTTSPPQTLLLFPHLPSSSCNRNLPPNTHTINQWPPSLSNFICLPKGISLALKGTWPKDKTHQTKKPTVPENEWHEDQRMRIAIWTISLPFPGTTLRSSTQLGGWKQHLTAITCSSTHLCFRLFSLLCLPSPRPPCAFRDHPPNKLSVPKSSSQALLF